MPITATKTDLTKEFAAVLGCKEKFVQTRLIVLGHENVCGRCGGGGHYSYCAMYGTTCFGCSGSGKVARKLTPTLLKTVTAQVAAGELEPYLAKLKDWKPALTIDPEREAFLAALRADPGDVTARLVFADWLAEHGEYGMEASMRAESLSPKEAFAGFVEAMRAEPDNEGTRLLFASWCERHGDTNLAAMLKAWRGSHASLASSLTSGPLLMERAKQRHANSIQDDLAGVGEKD